MNPKDVNEMLIQDIDRVVAMLLPDGQMIGGEWCAGDTSGSQGKSLKVRLSGVKKGVWKDFATGEGGDLLELWKACKGITFVDAFDQAKEYLGVPQKQPFVNEKAKPIIQPPKPQPSGQLLGWLTQERKIPEATIQAYKVQQENGHLIFPYYVEKDLMMVKYRALPKKIWSSPAPSPHLFGWQAISGDVREIIITEGELDAMACHAMGFPALSVPFGGGQAGKHSWIDNEYDRLERFDRIYLMMDQDETGKQAAEDIANRLGQHRVFVVDLPEKDANDCLLKDIDIIPYLKGASTTDPRYLKGGWEYESAIRRLMELENGNYGLSCPWIKVGQFRFRPSELTIWAGFNGHGKSQLLGHHVIDFISQGAKVCIASLEFVPERLLMKLYRQASSIDNPTYEYFQKTTQWLKNRLWVFGLKGRAKTQEILETFEFARRRYGVTHFVVDSLAKCGLTEEDYNGQKKFVEDLTDFAAEFKCHVHLVVHCRKQDSEDKVPNKFDIKGTGAITDMADNVVLVWRNKPRELAKQRGEEDDGSFDALMRVVKQRNGDWEGPVALWFDVRSYQYLGSESERPKTYIEM